MWEWRQIPMDHPDSSDETLPTLRYGFGPSRGIVDKCCLDSSSGRTPRSFARRSTTGVDVDLDRILDVDEEWRELKSRGDDLRHERNEVSSTIGELKQAGEEEAAQEAIERSQEVKSELQEIEERADELEAELEESLLELPRSPRVGAGRGRRVGERRATPRGVRRPARGSRQRGAPLRSGRGAGDPRLRARRESRRRRLLRREGRRRPAGACADPVHARRASRAGLP